MKAVLLTRVMRFFGFSFVATLLILAYTANFVNATEDIFSDPYYEPDEVWQYPPGYEQYGVPNESLYSYGVVRCPEPVTTLVATGWGGQSGSSNAGNLAFWDETNTNANYNNADYGLTELAMTWFFNASFQYQGDSVTGVFNQTNKPPWNATPNYVEAIVRIRINQYNAINSGFFSAYWEYDQTPTVDGMPWLQGTNAYNTIKNIGAGNNGNGFYNSTEMPYYQGNPFQPYVAYRFDITPMFEVWNSTILRGDYWASGVPSICIVWIQNQNMSSNDIDYLGIQWQYGSIMQEYTGYDDTQIHVDIEMNFNGLFWLLILFFPAIAMNQVLPVLGFSAGMALMLIILGFTQSGFAPFAIMGLIVIGIMIYKGD
jgi:hypothetical protein